MPSLCALAARWWESAANSSCSRRETHTNTHTHTHTFIDAILVCLGRTLVRERSKFVLLTTGDTKLGCQTVRGVPHHLACVCMCVCVCVCVCAGERYMERGEKCGYLVSFFSASVCVSPLQDKIITHTHTPTHTHPPTSGIISNGSHLFKTR